MAKPYEQEVVLDANGQPLFTAMDLFQRRVENIQKLIANIQKDSYKSVADFNKTLDANVKQLRDAMAAMRAVSQPSAKDQSFSAALKEQAQQRKHNYDEAKAFTQKEAKDRVEANRNAIRQMNADEREGARIVAENNRKKLADELAATKLIRSSRLEAARESAVQTAKQISDEKALQRARQDNIDKMQRYRAAQRTETDPTQLRALAQLIEMEKARGRALEQNLRTMETASRRASTLDMRTNRALVPSAVRQDVERLGINTVRENANTNLRLASQNLLNAATDKERIAALAALDVARARVVVVKQIAAEQNRVATAAERAALADSTLGTRSSKLLARSFAQDQIAAVGPTQAVAAAQERVLLATQRLAGAVGKERLEAIRNLEVENARLTATERRVAAINRAAAAEQRAAAAGQAAPPGAGGNGRGIGNILTPGYAGAAFARTSVYGAAAMAAYGAFNTVQQGMAGAIAMEDEFAKLQAIANATDTQMQSLKGSILGVAEGSRYAVTDLIKISQTLAQAGVSASDMTKVLSSVTTLATASGSTPDEAVNLVTSALGSFQLQSSEAARVADLMTEALNRTKLTVQQTGQAIQYVGATAFEQNISLEQLLATIGSVAQAGVKSGSTIGTGFRQFLVDLQDPSKKLTEQLTALKLTSADVDVSVRGLPAVLDTLKAAGFGAAQAYEGLETRAAAFYLTAKNNTDVADNLQMSFAYSNAAIIAQERAMESLTASWQKFKNIVQITFAGAFDGVITILKGTIDTLGQAILDMRNAAENLKNAPVPTTAGGRFKQLDQQLLQNIGSGSERILEKLLNGEFNESKAIFGIEGMGTALVNFGKSADGASTASEILSTKINESSEKIDAQKGKIGELDKEMIRLITQGDSLRNNQTRSAAETATLTSKFVGLANQIVITGNRYEDLISAMRRYRQEQLRTLGVEMQSQDIQLGQQVRESRGNLTKNIDTALNTQGLGLSQQERAALFDMRRNNVNSQEFSRGYGILAQAIERLRKDGNANVAVLEKISGPAGTLASTFTQRSALQPALAQNRGYQTEVGQFATAGTQKVSAIIEKLGSAEGASQASLARSGRSTLDTMERQLKDVLKRSLSSGARTFVEELLADIPSMRAQIDALTAADPKIAEKAAKDAAKAERTAAAAERRGPAITQAQFDALLSEVTGKPLGSGQRSATEQNQLKADGKTTAGADTSSHSKPGGIARDVKTGALSIAEGDRMEEAVRKAFKQRFGIDVYVKYESGRGRNNGTAPHLHANTLAGQRNIKPGSESRGDSEQFEFDTQTMQAQLELDRQKLAGSLKDMATATTKETFDAAVRGSKEALDRVNQSIRDIAANELASAGIANANDPRYQAKMAQVSQSIAQNVEAYQRGLADSILKSLNAMLKAAQEAYEAKLAPSQNALAIAQGAAAGLDRYSMKNRVPESVRINAAARVAKASEEADRAKLNNLPGLIEQQRSALGTQLQESTKLGLSPDEVARISEQITTITNNIKGLESARDNLAAAFGSEGLLPQTLGEGLDSAIQAYREMHNLNQSFTEMLNGEMLGAIETLGSALQNMFMSIMDGSRSVLGAMADFAKAIMQAIMQIVAKIIATQIIKLLFSLFAPGQPLPAGLYGGGPVPAGGGATGGSGPPGDYHGGHIRGYTSGGMINTGNDMRDSTLIRASKGEFVMRRAAVESVGEEFMHGLNKKGAKALASTRDTKPITLNPQQSVNVWMVKPDEKPQMGPQDVLVTWQNDVLSGGESRRLIQHVQKGG